MKKLFTFFSALFCANSIFAYDCVIDGIYYNLNTQERTARVTTAVYGYSGSIVIPVTITYNAQTYSVTEIGGYAFRACPALTSVTIPNSVITIGDEAFEGCDGLTSVTIPNSVITIGDYAFEGCDGLTSVTIGNSVTTIGNYAFRGCNGLTSITIPKSVTTIGERAFSSCSSLTSATWNAQNCNPCTYKDYMHYDYISVSPFYGIEQHITSFTFGNKVETIPSYLCDGMTKLTSVTIPNSVTTIGDDAFQGCSGLKGVYITNLAQWCEISFGSYVSNPLYYAHSLYLNNKLLTDLVIPNSVTTIGNYAFANCYSLTSVTIPNSVTTIGVDAFTSCNGLTSITIPCSVTSIGDYTFYGCSGLKSIQFDSNIPPTFGSDAFYNVPTSAIISVPCGYALNFKKVSALSQFKNYSSFGDFPYVLTVSSSDDAIGTTEISNAPDCITNEATIKATAIYGYRLDHWSDGDGQNPRTISITKDTHLVAYFSKRVYWVTTYATNGQVQGNKQVAYLDTCALTATPNYGYHFTQWSDGITDNPRIIQVLSDTTFTAEFAKNSYSFEVKANDNKRGSVEGTNGTYEYQTRLTISATARMDLGYHFARWSDGNTDNPRTLTLTENTVLVAEFEENKCGNNLIWHLKDNELLITGNGAMYDQGFVSWNSWASQITAISLSEGITYIGNNAFASCGNVQKIIIPSTVIGIGTNAFKNCSSIKSVIIPKAVTTIGNYSFAGCSYLAEVTLGSSLNSIGSHAFEGDSRIESITTYAEITPNVGTDAFKGVSKQYVYLYVPENSIRKYQVDPNWNEFDIRTKSADKKPIDGDNPIVTPTDQDVTITWPITDGASNYSLVITKNGEIVCTLTFNAQGQLLNIAFAAPGRDGAHQAPAATLTAQGYQFTVTGLNPGTAYNYSVTATDAGGKTLAEHKGNFSTTGGTGLNTLPYEGKDRIGSKYLHNGNLIIERNGIKYTATGQKVR